VIDTKTIKELLELMVEHGLSEMKLKDGEAQVVLRKGPTGTPMVMAAPMAMSHHPMAGAQPMSAPMAAPAPGAPKEDEGLVPIKSPMVGTFYATPDPESSPFVTIGSEIDANTTVCIIEAMKVFNEIKAEVAGTVERILVQNEQAVEFGQPLMLVRPRK
jgi:acetyl-CoA carboxylase biotin carboxyl carrier protein